MSNIKLTLICFFSNTLSGVGNIEFRNLVLSRKAEYLAAPSRDVKGRIANEVVDAVRSSGGRFVKKLNAKQLQEKGFKKDMNVYELADESTVLEKGNRYSYCCVCCLI